MNKKNLKIFFVDFWPNFRPDDNYFFNLLNQKYNVIIDPVEPDLLFHSVDYSGREQHKNYDGMKTKKIFYTGENINPDFENTDYSFSFKDNLGSKNMRLPLWVLYINWFDSKKDKYRDPSFLIPIKALVKHKSQSYDFKPFFCSFIASKPQGERVDFVPMLDDTKGIHNLGRLYSNSYLKAVGRGDQKNKLNYMKLFKFNIAFENEISDGYVTEKILHSFYARSIPIYWGTNIVKSDFNPRAFINAQDFSDKESLIDKIMTVSSSKSRQQKYLNEPVFSENKIPEIIMPNNVLDFFEEIIND